MFHLQNYTDMKVYHYYNNKKYCLLPKKLYTTLPQSPVVQYKEADVLHPPNNPG
nr:MAG TPA: hypothetical protein [Caudoviricetes sp.]